MERGPHLFLMSTSGGPDRIASSDWGRLAPTFPAGKAWAADAVISNASVIVARRMALIGIGGSFRSLAEVFKSLPGGSASIVQ
ncbi:hypothetical protein GL4_3355 [Methyloceanibacter caenitepidi]|uniref:Uncharacterized protein n=1 Tax=Methyloceanibacter caenitepidi TaxID=1384459 RepID=A0A0A8K758_9HYPH|nr:hypothetical protein GL4_3355 [Methyloceanibacter caenitepidi]